MDDLAIFNQPLPDYLQGAELDAATKILMGGSGTSSRRISIKGGVWRMMVGGKEVALNEDRAMNVVIIAAAPKVSRTFYPPYVEGEKQAPLCWSADGDYPDTTAKSPQAKSCAICPQNIAGSGKDNTRACRYSQRIAVVLENDVGGDIYQLTLPATSIFGEGEVGKWPLKTYAKMIGGTGTPISSVVTEMRFDTKSAVPKLFFRAIKRLTQQEYGTAMLKSQSQEAVRAVTMTAPLDTAKPKVEVKQLEVVKEQVAEEPTKRAEKKETTPPATKKKIEDVLQEWDDE